MELEETGQLYWAARFKDWYFVSEDLKTHEIIHLGQITGGMGNYFEYRTMIVQRPQLTFSHKAIIALTQLYDSATRKVYWTQESEEFVSIINGLMQEKPKRKIRKSRFIGDID